MFKVEVCSAYVIAVLNFTGSGKTFWVCSRHGTNGFVLSGVDTIFLQEVAVRIFFVR